MSPRNCGIVAESVVREGGPIAGALFVATWLLNLFPVAEKLSQPFGTVLCWTLTVGVAAAVAWAIVLMVCDTWPRIRRSAMSLQQPASDPPDGQPNGKQKAEPGTRVQDLAHSSCCNKNENHEGDGKDPPPGSSRPRGAPHTNLRNRVLKSHAESPPKKRVLRTQ